MASASFWDTDCVVIGAGAVGLATGRALAERGLEVVVLERESMAGSGTTSRSSEVIHTGIYYSPGSLKARLCVRGRRDLVAWMEARGVAHEVCGKFALACEASELAALEALAVRAQANGAVGVRLVDASYVRRLEPAARCLAGCEAPAAGVMDSHGLVVSFLGALEDAGGVLALGSPVEGGALMASGGVELRVGGREPMTLRARICVNAAGLAAPALARRFAGLAPEAVPRAYWAKGSWFSLRGAAPFTRLVYPMPSEAGLGVHYTRDLAGRAKFGPDVEWVDAPSYDVDPAKAEAFAEAVRRYWPGLPDGMLMPDQAGVRPKLQAPGEAAHDFMIAGSESHGHEGLVNLFGIESPGLTASLAIADEVLSRLRG